MHAFRIFRYIVVKLVIRDVKYAFICHKVLFSYWFDSKDAKVLIIIGASMSMLLFNWQSVIMYDVSLQI